MEPGVCPRRLTGMRARVAVLVFVLAMFTAGVAAWRFARASLLPPNLPRPVADQGVIKSDLFNFARAEHAYFAMSGHYAEMDELRAKGLLTLPPNARWPYFYSIYVIGSNRFAIVAMASGPLSGRPVALVIDDALRMRKYTPDDHRHRRRDPRLRQT